MFEYSRPIAEVVALLEWLARFLIDWEANWSRAKIAVPINFYKTRIEDQVIIKRITEGLILTFTPSGIREFVPRDQVSPCNCLLLFITSTQK